MNMKEYKTKIFLTMILGVLSVCLFTGCSNNVEPGKFVAIRSDGIIAYSTDGVNWTERSDQLKPVTAPAEWFRICYGDGKFVAIAYDSNDVASSTDGETWSQTTINSNSAANKWTSLTYGNGKFVAVSDEPTKRIVAAYSTNGRDWNPADFSADLPDLPADVNWRGVCYGIGMFVAISEEGKTAYSTNGEDWYEGWYEGNKGDPLEPSTVRWESVCYGKGKFVAKTLGNSTEKVKVAYSTNGIDWIPVEEPELLGYTGTWFTSCYGNGKFVMVEGNGGNRAVYSTDGIHWSKAKEMPAGSWFYVCYGNGMFIAIAEDGQIANSEDGINWNIGAKLSTPPFLDYWQGLAYGLDSDVFGFL